MGRWIALTLLLMATGASWAGAQVAVPELAPLGVRQYSVRAPIVPMTNATPENPAAMQWGTPSRIGGGVFNGTVTDSVFGQSSRAEGTIGGFRFVGHGMALAAESMDIAVDLPGIAPAPAAQLSKRARSVAASFPIVENGLAWGLSRDVLVMEGNTGAPGYTATRLDISGWTFGISGWWGDHFFWGAAAGTDSASQVLPGPPLDVKRDHNMVGLALRGGGSLVWRLEYDRLFRGDFQDTAGNLVEYGYTTSQYSLEAVWIGIIASYTGYTVTDPLGPGSQVKGSTFDFGIAPLTGITITARIERSDTSTPAGDTVSESIRTIGASWQF